MRVEKKKEFRIKKNGMLRLLYVNNVYFIDFNFSESRKINSHIFSYIKKPIIYLFFFLLISGGVCFHGAICDFLKLNIEKRLTFYIKIWKQSITVWSHKKSNFFLSVNRGIRQRSAYTQLYKTVIVWKFQPSHTCVSVNKRPSPR